MFYKIDRAANSLWKYEHFYFDFALLFEHNARCRIVRNVLNRTYSMSVIALVAHCVPHLYADGH